VAAASDNTVRLTAENRRMSYCQKRSGQTSSAPGRWPEEREKTHVAYRQAAVTCGDDDDYDDAMHI